MLACLTSPHFRPKPMPASQRQTCSHGALLPFLLSQAITLDAYLSALTIAYLSNWHCGDGQAAEAARGQAFTLKTSYMMVQICLPKLPIASPFPYNQILNMEFHWTALCLQHRFLFKRSEL